MDTVKPLCILLGAALVDGSFFAGVGEVLSKANVPHTSEALGEVVTFAVIGLVSQALNWWRTRYQVTSALKRVSLAKPSLLQTRIAEVRRKRKASASNV